MAVSNGTRTGERRTQTRVIARLSDILLDEMGREELTIGEMAVRCGISKRKLGEIIYREKKGLLLEILLTICESLKIDCAEILKSDSQKPLQSRNL